MSAPEQPDRLAEIKAITGAGRRDGDALESVLISNSALDWLIAEVERLRAALSGLNEAVNGLMADSGGVYGLHLNGDEAPWDSLTSGGRFEDWLGPALDQARAALEQAP